MATLTSTTDGFTIEITDAEFNAFIVEKAVEAGKTDAAWPTGGEAGDSVSYTVKYADATEVVLQGQGFSFVVDVIDETAA